MPRRDISATVAPIGVKVCKMVELCARKSFSTFGDDIFRGHQMRGQEMGSGGSFWHCKEYTERLYGQVKC